MPERPILPLPYQRARSCPFDPSEELARLRREHPITRIALPSEKSAWLVTRYEDVRRILSDARFSTAPAPRTLLRPPGVVEPPPSQPGTFIISDRQEHDRLRRMLTGEFTVRRMIQIAPRVKSIVAENLNAMEAAGPPTDLFLKFASPVPWAIISELFDIPDADWAEVKRRISAKAPLIP